MKRLHLTLLLAAAIALPAQAQIDRTAGDDAGRMGFSIGARAAYAFPFGDIVTDSKMNDSFDQMIPLWLDATLRLGRGLEIGPYLQYGWVSGKNGGPDAKDWRLGAQLNYRLTPAGGLAPWIGVGAGWEWLKIDNAGSSGDISGIDFMLQGGADFRVSPNVAIGPFVAITLGRFSSGTIFDAPINAGKAWHEWVQVGAKLSFDL